MALSALCLPFVTPALRRVCLPYVPATDVQVANVLRALRGRTGSLVDIGSGDGRIVTGLTLVGIFWIHLGSFQVLEAARSGFRAHGIELNVWLVLYARWRAFRSSLTPRATFAKQDLWKSDLSQYDNVVIFGVEEMVTVSWVVKLKSSQGFDS